MVNTERLIREDCVLRFEMISWWTFGVCCSLPTGHTVFEHQVL